MGGSLPCRQHLWRPQPDQFADCPYRYKCFCRCLMFLLSINGYLLEVHVQILLCVFLALCVLSENCCIQRSVQVVVHCRDVDPVQKKKKSHSDHYYGAKKKKKKKFFLNRPDNKSDLLVLFTSFWCSVRTRSFVSGGIKTKSIEASSSKISLRAGFGEPNSSFV